MKLPNITIFATDAPRWFPEAFPLLLQIINRPSTPIDYMNAPCGILLVPGKPTSGSVRGLETLFSCLLTILLVLTLLAAPCQPSAASGTLGWTTLPEGTLHALATDPEGSPRLAYLRENTLFYAWYEDGWREEPFTFETIQWSGSAEALALEVDEYGQAHLFFIAGATLHYLRQDGAGEWISTPFTHLLSNVKRLSAQLRVVQSAVDPVLLVEYEGSGLEVLQFSGDDWWVRLRVMSAVSSARMRLDAEGNPHCLYFSNVDLVYSYSPFYGIWEQETIADTRAVFGDPVPEVLAADLQFLPDGTPIALYLSFEDQTNREGALKLATRLGHYHWEERVIEEQVPSLANVSFAQGAAGLEAWYLHPTDRRILGFAINESAIEALEPIERLPFHPFHAGLLRVIDAGFGQRLVWADNKAEPWQFLATRIPVSDRADRNPAMIGRILETLGITDPDHRLDPGDLAQLSTLDLSGLQLEEVGILRHATGLVSLDVSDNRLTDLSPIGQLPNLQTLDASGNGLDATTDSEDALLMESLQLRGVAVDWSGQVSPWNWMLDPALEATIRQQIGLIGGQPFEPFHHQWLTRVEGPAESLRGLEMAHRLEELVLPFEPIEDLRPLAGLEALRIVDLSKDGNPMRRVRDLRPLATLANLEALFLHDNRVVEFEVLNGLHHLRELDLAQNLIHDLTPAATLPALTRLDLSNNFNLSNGSLNRIRSLEPLLDPALALEWIDLSGNQIRELAGVGSWPSNLQELALNGNGLDQSSGSENERLIDELESSGPHVTWHDQRSPWNWMLDPNLEKVIREELNLREEEAFQPGDEQNLSSLDASERYIRDLTGLELARELQWVDLSNNRIDSIESLRGLSNLHSLDLSNYEPLMGFENRIEDLEPLRGRHQLADLYVGNNQVTDLEPLLECHGLTHLEITGNGLDEREGSLNDLQRRQLETRGVNIDWYGQRSPWNWALDPALEAAMRHALGLPGDDEFEPDDHGRLTDLDASGLGLTDLEDLALATGLRYLDLSGNFLSDLSGLEAFTELREVDLSNNQIESIEPLLTHFSLYHVDLEGNAVSESQAERLGARGVSVHLGDQRSPWNWKLDPALALAIRQELWLAPQEAFEVSHHQQLTSLDASDLGIHSLEGLELATELEYLDLSGNAIVDCAPLASLSRLYELDLSNPEGSGSNFITDLSSLAGLRHLEVLKLNRNGVTNPAPLACLPALDLVELEANGLDERPESAAYRIITAMEARGVWFDWGNQQSPWNWMTDAGLQQALRDALGRDSNDPFEPSDHAQLTHLYADELGIESLAGLELATNLEQLEANNNRIEDLRPLAGLPRLESISLENNNDSRDGNRIQDLEPLRTNDALIDLRLNYNQVTDITPLLDLPNLWSVDLDGNGLDLRDGSSTRQVIAQLEQRDVWVHSGSQRSPWNWLPDAALQYLLRLELGLDHGEPFELWHHPDITEINAPGFGVRNLEGLQRASALTRIDLRSNAIADLTPLGQLSQLEELLLGNDPLLEQHGNFNIVSDLQPLENLSNLRILDLEGNRITSLAVTLGLSALETLLVSRNGLDLTEEDTAASLDLQSLLQRGIAVSAEDQRSPWNWMLQPQLLHAIQRELGTQEPFAIWAPRDLYSLEATGYGITSLEGLELAIFLEDLRLPGNAVRDLTPLEGLQNLRWLDLSNDSHFPDYRNRVRNLQPLANLPVLEELLLRENEVSDASPLSSIASLLQVDLSGNGLDERQGSSDQQVVSALLARGVSVDWSGQRSPWNWSLDCELELALRFELGVGGVPFEPYHHEELHYLDARGRMPIDLGGLELAWNLEELGLEGRKVASFEPISMLDSLQSLRLMETIPPDLAPLGLLPALTQVDLRGATLELEPASLDRLLLESLEAKGVEVTLFEAPNLQAVAVDEGIALSWTRDPLASTLQLQREEVDGADARDLELMGQESHLDSSVQKGQVYTYQLNTSLDGAFEASTAVQAFHPLMFEDWLASVSHSGEDALPGADPDGNGSSQAIDFVFNLQEQSPGRGTLPFLEESGTDLQMVMRVPKARSGYSLITEFTQTLGGWDPVQPDVTIDLGSMWEYRFDVPDGEAGFFRATVTLLP